MFPCLVFLFLRASMSGDGELSQAQAPVVGRDPAVAVDLKVLPPQPSTRLMRKQHVEKDAAAQDHGPQTRRFPEPATNGADDIDECRMEAPGNKGAIRSFYYVLCHILHERA